MTIFFARVLCPICCGITIIGSREQCHWSAELSKLRGEVGALRKENDDLKEEIEAQKAQVN